MSSEQIIHQLRRFLLVLADLLCIGTVAELVLEKHYKETNQLIPFALCFIGLLSLLAFQTCPGRGTIRALRLSMVLLIAGSVVGGILHLSTNYAYAIDIHPNSTTVNSFLTALSGAAPLLAPGMLAVAGIIALAATYFHPSLQPHTA